MGLDEPSFYIFDGIQLTRVDDPCVHNKICSQILPLEGTKDFFIIRNHSMISLMNIKTLRVQNMIEDASSAAWYQQSVHCTNSTVMWTVKECIDTHEFHLIRQIELLDDFYLSLTINRGLPPANM